MEDGIVKTITVATVDKRGGWNRPTTTQFYYTITTTENSAEPTKFIGDSSREINAPEVGRSYLGKMFGDKFYPAKLASAPAPAPAQPTVPDESLSPAEQISQNTTNQKPKDGYWDDKDSAIRAQWAIGQAVQLQLPQGLKMPHYDELEVSAKLLYAMVDRVRDYDGLKVADAPASQPESVESEDHFTPEEVRSLADALDKGQRIDLDDIPF